MATLVAPLASGIIGAEDGSVEFFVRGSSSLSSLVYSDPEGVTRVTSTTLGASGEAERYVEEPVDVIVYDADGASVRTFTVMGDARAARLENDGWTGSNALGQEIAGGRTTVDEMATRLYDTFGLPDAKVDIDGTATYVKDALLNSAAVFYNVVRYGADITGSDDSTAAIQLAINDAQVSGGIVFFPGGTYKIISGLVATGAVTFMGSGESSIIKATTVSSMAFFTLSAAAHFIGLKFQHNTPASGGQYISAGSGVRVHVIGCHFDTFGGPYLYITHASASVDATGCYFLLSTASAALLGGTGAGLFRIANSRIEITAVSTLLSSGALPKPIITGCHISVTAAISALFSGSSTMTGCLFDASGLTALTTTITSGTSVVTGCNFPSTGGGTLTIADSGTLYESGCVLGTGVTYGVSALGGSSVLGNDWDARTTATTLAGISYTPSCEYGVHLVTHSSGATMAFANPSPDGFQGMTLVLVYKNSTGGNRTPTFGTNYLGLAASAVGDTKMSVFVFRRLSSISTKWINVSPTNSDYTP